MNRLLLSHDRRIGLRRTVVFAVSIFTLTAAVRAVTSEAYLQSAVQLARLVVQACPVQPAGDALALADSIIRASATHGVDPALVLSVVAMESQCRINTRSARGAVGLMQLMPATAAWLGVDPNNSEANLNGGTRYLALLLGEFGGDISLALAAYNAGPKSVRKYRKVPPFKETQQYVVGVLATYYRLNATVRA